MSSLVLLLGSNIGDRRQYIEQAILLIEKKIGKIIQESLLYETEAWGDQSQRSFINQVVVVSTDQPPHTLLKNTLFIEEVLGRVRSGKKWQARTIDIDILFYNNFIYSDANLTIPHPQLHQRKFTLIPLLEIMPNFIHPKFKKTIKELLENCKDDMLSVKRFDNA